MEIMPKCGVGVIIIKDNSKVLAGIRKNSHGEGVYAFPGGKIDIEDCKDAQKPGIWACAEREAFEEAGMIIECFSPDGIRDELFITTDILGSTENQTYLTAYVLAKYIRGGDYCSKDKIWPKEPEKCEMWEWLTCEELEKIVNTGNDTAKQWIPINRIIKYLSKISVE